MKAKTQNSYGIMAIIHIPGVTPECDETHFDGWYSGCPGIVQGIFELFKKRYPGADVFVVKQEKSEWRQCQARVSGDIIQQIGYPLHSSKNDIATIDSAKLCNLTQKTELIIGMHVTLARFATIRHVPT
jgi:hypothetical protein